MVKDERILKLDEIVTEVKQSEEWEAVRMSILSVGIERGREEGLRRGREEGLKSGREELKEELPVIEQIIRELNGEQENMNQQMK